MMRTKRRTKGKSSERNKASGSRSELVHELVHDGTDIEPSHNQARIPLFLALQVVPTRSLPAISKS